jgi:hypothetical protein
MPVISARVGVLAGAGIAIFAVITIILLRMIPEPRKDTDYLVIGTLATFGALGLLFAVAYVTDRRRAGGAKSGETERGGGAGL